MNWSDWLNGWSLPQFARGIHPETGKDATAGSPIRVLATPGRVLLPMHQHAGLAADCVVQPRDVVAVGAMIGRPAVGGISAGVHASMAGTVRPMTAVTLPNGHRSLAVPVESSGGTSGCDALFEELFGGEWPSDGGDDLSSSVILDRIREAGIVGLGGAAFPAHIKLAPVGAKPVNTILLNGCECEPFLTADDQLMRQAPHAILTGAILAMRARGASEIVIAIEDNKPEAIAAMRSASAARSMIRIVVCATKYPMGGERQLIPAVFGKAVPTGGLPHDLGIVVVNVGTAAAIASAVVRRRPLTHRVVTVTGSGVRAPANLLAPLGVSLQSLLDACGGLTDDAQRVIAGGPMMGYSVTDLSIPLTKGTSGLTVMTRADVDIEAATACIRCGRCVDVCPLHLMPTRIAHAVKHQQLEVARQFDLEACCECGCCAWECPARIPLVQYLRMGKAAVQEQRRRGQHLKHLETGAKGL